MRSTFNVILKTLIHSPYGLVFLLFAFMAAEEANFIVDNVNGKSYAV
jgi:hypothetical protein